MVDVLLDNRELTSRRLQAFASGRELRNSDQHSAFVEISSLFFDADFHRRLTANVIAVPIGDVVSRRAGSWSGAVNAAEILGLSRVADVLFTAGDEQGRYCQER